MAQPPPPPQQPYPPPEGQPPYPAEGQQPYPPAEGQPAYPPPEGQPPYPPAEGQPAYPPAEGQPPYPPAEGQPAYPPAEGQPPYPAEGQPPYPAEGQPPYPAEGQPPYPAEGQPPYPAEGQPPYPIEGQPPYPVEGQPPYPVEGQPPYPVEGQPPYPVEGQPPYPVEGQPPYPFEGQPPYPVEGQPPYPAEGMPPPEGYGGYPPGVDPSASRTSEFYRYNQGEWGAVGPMTFQREATPADSTPVDSFIQSYRSLAYLDSDSFIRFARYGADTCSIDFTDKALTDTRDFLRKTQLEDGATLWTHIRDVLEKVLLERPSAPASFLDEFSQRTRASRSKPDKRYPRDRRRPAGQKQRAHRLLELVRAEPPPDAQWPGGGAPGADDAEDAAGGGGGGDEEEGGEGGGKIKPMRWQDLQGVNRLLSQAGIGIPNEEAMLVNLAMRQLCHDQDILRVRFWGKIFGTKKNYLIVEADLSDNGLNRRLQEAEASLMGEGEEMEGEGERKPEPDSSTAEGGLLKGSERETEMGEEEGEGVGPWGYALPPFWTKPPPAFPPLPQAVIKPDVAVPSEAPGTGVNRKVYYVTSNPTDGWTSLPDVTPAQITAARLIRRYLTGNLKAPVKSCPAFPGAERNLLRAQIARISAATHVSPIGFYSSQEELGEGLEEEEDEELEGEGGGGGARRGAVPENPRYRPVPLADLLDPSGASWVHHAEHILRQGRTKWWNPALPQKREGEEEEEEREEMEEEEMPFDINAPEPEVGPGILTPLSEDASLEAMPTWTFRAGCSMLTTLWGSVLARSNLWPGAWAFTMGTQCVNIYVGWGLRAVAHSFTPSMPGPPQREYPVGPEIMEQTDPTPQQEEDWRMAHMPPKPMQFGEEGLFEDEDYEGMDPDD